MLQTGGQVAVGARGGEEEEEVSEMCKAACDSSNGAKVDRSICLCIRTSDHSRCRLGSHSQCAARNHVKDPPSPSARSCPLKFPCI